MDIADLIDDFQEMFNWHEAHGEEMNCSQCRHFGKFGECKVGSRKIGLQVDKKYYPIPVEPNGHCKLFVMPRSP